MKSTCGIFRGGGGGAVGVRGVVWVIGRWVCFVYGGVLSLRTNIPRSVLGTTLDIGFSFHSIYIVISKQSLLKYWDTIAN
jgi:hypothetical protein